MTYPVGSYPEVCPPSIGYIIGVKKKKSKKMWRGATHCVCLARAE